MEPLRVLCALSRRSARRRVTTYERRRRHPAYGTPDSRARPMATLLLAHERRRRRDPRCVANPLHGLGASRDLQLLEHVVNMVFDGGHAHEELTPDLLVRESAAEELQHFALA